MRSVLAILLTLAVTAPCEARHGRGGPAAALLLLPAVNNIATNWQNAGLQPVGGIPTRSTQCGSTVSPSGLTPPTSGDDASLIQAAINACTAGQVVQLASGTFNIAMSEVIVLGKGVSLRGTGSCTNGSTPYCSTAIVVYNGMLAWTGGQCGVDTSHEVACTSNAAIEVQPSAAANQFDFGWSGSMGHCGLLSSAIGCGTPVDADAAQGATTIQVASTTGFSVGTWALIDEASGATWQNDPVGPNLRGQVWAAPDWLSASPSPATGRVQWDKYGNGTGDMGTGDYPYNNPHVIQSLYDRATSEIHVVTAVGAGPCPGTNCTLTFDDPVTVAFRKSGATTFTGSTSGTTLTTSGDNCTTTVGQIVGDATDTLLDGTYVTAVNSCSGGAGNYTISRSQTVSSETMYGGAHQAHVYFPTKQNGTAMAFISQAGVENLTISRPTSGGINFQFCAYCWAKNVEIVNWGGGAVNFSYTVRDQFDTSFANNCAYSVNNGGEYPLGIQDASTEIYIVNSITRLCGKGMVGKAAAAAVVAYNYVDDSFYDYWSAIGNYWEDMSVNGSHFAGTHHFLFEGNWGSNCDNDDTHGNAMYHVYFRNDCTALRTPFTDPSMVANGQSANAAVNDAAGTGWEVTTGQPGSADTPGVLRAAGPMLHNYWLAYVGNVLGTSGTTTAGNGWTYSGDYSSSKHIWMPGWNSDSNNPTKSDPNINGVSATYLFKSGNFDFLNGSITDWASGYSQTLPNSLYLTSTPAFFSAGSCTYPWPWITPTASPYVKTNSCSGSGLPAQARWNAGTPFVQP